MYKDTKHYRDGQNDPCQRKDGHKYMRTEKDKFGELQIEDNALYGIQSTRARDNFTLHYKKTNLDLIYAIIT